MKIQQLTFLRFLAAIAIVFFHFAQNLKPFCLPDLKVFVERWNSGVSFFFVLSGFIMIIANQKQVKIKFIDFFSKRIFRIYPMYLLALGAIVLYHTLTHTTIVYKDLLLNIFILQSWIPTKALTYNFPSWTIPVEFFFYLLFPFFFNFVYRKVSFKSVTVMIILLWIVSQVLIHSLRYSDWYLEDKEFSKSILFYNPITHLNQFLIGILFGLLFLKSTRKKNMVFPILIACTILCAVLFYSEYFLLTLGFLAPIFALLIYLVSIDNGPITKFFSLPFNVYLGEISYSIYILQFPVFLWLSSISKRLDLENQYLLFYLNLFILLIVSHLCYKYFELPIREKLYAKLDKSHERQS